MVLVSACIFKGYHENKKIVSVYGMLKLEIWCLCFCTVDERIQFWAEFLIIALCSVRFDHDLVSSKAFALLYLPNF